MNTPFEDNLYIHLLTSYCATILMKYINFSTKAKRNLLWKFNQKFILLHLKIFLLFHFVLKNNDMKEQKRVGFQES